MSALGYATARPPRSSATVAGTRSPQRGKLTKIRPCSETVTPVGMGPRNVLKITVFLTDRELVPLWREARDVFFDGHAPTSTLLLVAGLADPRFQVEVEAEAAD